MTKTEFTDAVLAAEPTLYRVAKSMLGSEADCADAAQNAILHAWERLDTLKKPEYFKTCPHAGTLRASGTGRG